MVIFASSLIFAAYKGFFAASAQYDSAAGVVILKSITPHFPSHPGLADEERNLQALLRSPANCFVGFCGETFEMGGAAVKLMCACFAKSAKQPKFEGLLRFLGVYVIHLARSQMQVTRI